MRRRPGRADPHRRPCAAGGRRGPAHPGSLAILQASFRPSDRSRAIGAWSGLGGVATAIGPFLGGWLVGAASWRLIFAINVPIAAVVVLIAWRHVPESRDATATGRIDVLGGTLVTLGLVGVTYGLIESLPIFLIAGALFLAAFVWWERRTAHPMLPLDLFAAPQFSATNVVTFVIYGAIGGALFLLPIQLQQVAGYTPLQAGVSSCRSPSSCCCCRPAPAPSPPASAPACR